VQVVVIGPLIQLARDSEGSVADRHRITKSPEIAEAFSYRFKVVDNVSCCYDLFKWPYSSVFNNCASGWVIKIRLL